MSWLLLTILAWVWHALVFAQVHPFPGPRVTGSGAAPSPPVLTGTSSGPVVVPIATASGSGSVTVPADATMVMCLVVAFSSTAGRLSSATVTLGGQAMTGLTGGDSSTTAMQAALYYKVTPLTGAQTLAWTFSGVLTDAGAFWCVYYKGVNTSTPLRSSSCTQTAANPRRTASLTVVSGDTAVGLPWSWENVTNVTFTFLTVAGDIVMTLRQDFTSSNVADAAWGDATPTANGTIGANVSVDADGGICGLVLRP